MKNHIAFISWVGLLACGWACSAADQIEFSRIVAEDQDCVSCQTFEYVNSVGLVEKLLFSTQADLVLDPREIQLVSIFKSDGNASGWSVMLDLDEAQQSEWLKFVAGTGGGRVIVSVKDEVAVVLEDSEMRFLVLSEFESLNDVENFLSNTNLKAKAVQISDAQIKRANTKIRAEHPKLDDRLRESDEALERAKDESERWKRLDSLLDEEPQNLEAARAELKSIM